MRISCVLVVDTAIILVACSHTGSIVSLELDVTRSGFFPDLRTTLNGSGSCCGAVTTRYFQIVSMDTQGFPGGRWIDILRHPAYGRRAVSELALEQQLQIWSAIV